MKRPTPTALVGFVTLIAFILFLGFTFAIKGNLFGGRMEMNVLFERVSGLEVGSPVYVAGVYAGEITQISYRPEHMGKPVMVTLGLNRNFQFYRNATVKIVQFGIIGDKRLEIDPGTPEYQGLPYGEAITGEQQFDVDQSLRKAQQIVNDLAASMSSFREFVTDEANLKALRNTLQAMEEGINSVNTILLENRENLRETANNLRLATERTNALLEKTESLVDTADSSLRDTRSSIDESLVQLNAEMKRAVDEIERVGNGVDSAMAETRNLVSTTSEKVGPTLENLETAASTLNDILVRIREGRGTMGQLINNPSPFIELDRTLRAIRRALLGRSGIEATVQYEELGTTLDRPTDATKPDPKGTPPKKIEATPAP